MFYTTPDKLTADMLTRVTAGGTINPAKVPQAPTQYRQVGQLFYPQLSQCFALVAQRWGHADMRGDHMAGYMAVTLVCRAGGAHALHDMARLEIALYEMAKGPRAQARAAIVAYMCGEIGNPDYRHFEPHTLGGDARTWDKCAQWARPMLALTASESL